MRKATSIAALLMFVVIMLVGCGEKSAEDVVTELEKKLTEMNGYKTKMSMMLDTGQESQSYEVDIWHKAQHYYRVSLKNSDKEQGQIILRNDEGVFVLTPALSKSFRFQSDWPTNGSQVYLYDSLIRDILMDPSRTFESTDTHYIFTTATNYQNKNFQTQQIILNKKDLSPVEVSVMNIDRDVLIKLEVSQFEWDASFNDGDFDMERNMTGAQMEEEEAIGEQMPLQVFYPMYTPDGTEFDQSETIETDAGQRVILQYVGSKPFTLIQESSEAVSATTIMTPTIISEGEPVDLGFAIGVQTEESLMWTYDGVDFLLASTVLDKEEMMSIARSVHGTLEK